MVQNMVSLESCSIYYGRVRSACSCMGGQPGKKESNMSYGRPYNFYVLSLPLAKYACSKSGYSAE